MWAIDLLVVEMYAVEVIQVVLIPPAVVTIPPPLFQMLTNVWADEGLNRQMLRNDGMMNEPKH